MDEGTPSERAPSAPPPATYHIMLRAGGAGDFRRAGSIRLAAEPPSGSLIEVNCDGRKLMALVEAVFIAPGCEENCIGTLFLAEA